MWMDYEFWYDLESKEQNFYQNMNFLATMGPPSSGRNSISPRTMHHFFVLYVTSFDDSSLKLIYENILEWHFQRQSPKFLSSIVNLKETIVDASI